MNKIIAIVRREVMSFFLTPRGYLILSVFAATTGFYFFNILGRYNFLVSRTVGMQLDVQMQLPTLRQFVIERYFQMVVISFVALVPVLTMRSFAAERSEGTFALLRTSAVSTAEIVIGKFLSIAVLISIFTAVSALFILSLQIYGNPDAGQIWGGLLGVYLCGLSFSALSLLVSVRAEQQVSAAVGGIAVLGLFTLIHTPAALLSPAIARLLQTLSPIEQLSGFTQGYASLASIGYFLGIILISLCMAGELLNRESQPSSEFRPFSFSSRFPVLPTTVILGASGIALSMIQTGVFSLLTRAHLFLALAGVGLLFGGALRDRSLRSAISRNGQFLAVIVILLLSTVLLGRTHVGWDMSASAENTISTQTKRLLDQLPAPLEIFYFSRRDASFDQENLWRLQRFRNASPQITVQQIDPVSAPQLATALGAHKGDLIALRLTSSPEIVARLPRADEDVVRQAIAALLEPQPKRVYVLNGFGVSRAEDLSPLGISNFLHKLTAENIEIRMLDRSSATIPKDAAVVLVVGPREPLSKEITDALLEYVHTGGRIFATTDPLFFPNVEPLFSALGVTSRNTLIVDSDQLVFSGGEAGFQPLIRRFGEHPIVNSFARSGVIIMNAATPLSSIDLAAAGWDVSAVAFSSEGSFEESRVLDALQGKISLTDPHPGTSPDSHQSVAVAVTDSTQSPVAVFFGDSDWLMNSAFDYYSNSELATNSMQWLLGRAWALAPRLRREQSASVAISSFQFERMTTLTIIGIEFLALAGLFWCSHRQRRGDKF